MRTCAAISASSGFKAYRISFLNQFFNTDFKAIQSSLISNYGEFAIIKMGVVYSG
jgi:hypothetical protein